MSKAAIISSTREDFLVAVRPAEAHEVVQQRLGQIALVPVLQHADRAVALGELGAVRARGSSARARTPAARLPSARSMFICRGVLLR